MDTSSPPSTYPSLAGLQELEATKTALENVEYLATGYEDRIFILLEPADKEATVSCEETRSGIGSLYTGAVQLMDETLQLAFNNQRHVDNTIIDRKSVV